MRSWSVWCMVFLSVALFEFSWVTCKPANNYSKSWVRLSTWLIFKLNGSAAKLKDCFWNFTAAGNKLCEDMNSGLPRTSPGNGQGGTKTLDQTMQVRPSNGSVTLPHSLQYLRLRVIVNWQTAVLLLSAEALQCTLDVPQGKAAPFLKLHLIDKFPLPLYLNCGGFHVTLLLYVGVIFWSGGQYTTSGPELSVNTTLIYLTQVCLIHDLDNRNHYFNMNFF